MARKKLNYTLPTIKSRSLPHIMSVTDPYLSDFRPDGWPYVEKHTPRTSNECHWRSRLVVKCARCESTEVYSDRVRLCKKCLERLRSRAERELPVATKGAKQ